MLMGQAGYSHMVEVPKILAYGLGDERKVEPFFFEGKVASDLMWRGSSFYRLHKGGITLGEQAALYNAYLLRVQELMKGDNGLDEVLYAMFERRGLGNVTDDACDFDNYDRNILRSKTKPTDMAVRWIFHPEKFSGTDVSSFEAVLGPQSRWMDTIVPKKGYVELTCDGSYRPGTGTPFSTVKTRAEAVKSWTDKGFDPDFAEVAVSEWACGTEGRGKGTYSVLRWADDFKDTSRPYEKRGGPFDICVELPPNYALQKSVGAWYVQRPDSEPRKERGRAFISSDGALSLHG
jgi:hypothetical protein